MVTSLNLASSKKPYHLIVDTSSYLRLLAGTPEINSVYCSGYLSILEIMTKKGLLRPVFTSEVLSEILNSAAIISAEDIFRIDHNTGQAKSFVANYDMQRFIKPFTRIESLRRMHNAGAVFLKTDVEWLYLSAIKYDRQLSELELSNGLKVWQATPDILNKELLKWKENAHVIEVLKKRRLRSDIGEISCGVAALKLNGKVPCSILFQGNDVRSRAIYRANGYDPFIEAVRNDNEQQGVATHKPVPCEFNPHRKSFNPEKTKPIASVGCLSTTAFLLPFIMRSKQDGLGFGLLSPNEADDSTWYHDSFPDNSLRGHLLSFLRSSSSRIGGKNYNEYDALKDIYFSQIDVAVKHEHNFVNDKYISPWWDFIFSLDKEVFKDVMLEIRKSLDLEAELFRKSSKSQSLWVNIASKAPTPNGWEQHLKTFPERLSGKLPASVTRDPSPLEVITSKPARHI